MFTPNRDFDVTDPRHGLAAVAALEAVIDGRRDDLLTLIPDDPDERAALIVVLAEVGGSTVRRTIDFPGEFLEGLRTKYVKADREAGR